MTFSKMIMDKPLTCYGTEVRCNWIYVIRRFWYIATIHYHRNFVCDFCLFLFFFYHLLWNLLFLLFLFFNFSFRLIRLLLSLSGYNILWNYFFCGLFLWNSLSLFSILLGIFLFMIINQRCKPLFIFLYSGLQALFINIMLSCFQFVPRLRIQSS